MIKTRALIEHLLTGGDITNGPHRICPSHRPGKYYLSCHIPGCCDDVLNNIEEVASYISGNEELWEIEYSDYPWSEADKHEVLS